jgi:hypothetical protein
MVAMSSDSKESLTHKAAHCNLTKSELFLILQYDTTFEFVLHGIFMLHGIWCHVVLDLKMLDCVGKYHRNLRSRTSMLAQVLRLLDLRFLR